jgi:phage shock protein PspC (stress-responsive transcriptional regulator)
MIFARQGKKFDYDLKQVKLIAVLLSFMVAFQLDISQL